MNKLRVGIVVNQRYRPESGGGYSYYNILLKAINNYEFPEDIEIFNIFLYNDVKPGFELKQPNIYIRDKFRSRWKKIVKHTIFRNISQYYSKRNLIHNYVININRTKLDRKAENILRANKIDLLYYLSADETVLNYPFIMTHWDVGHRSTYPFPKLSMDGIYEARENYYSYILNKALFITCESRSGAEELSSFYNFYKRKIKVVPIFGGVILDIVLPSLKQEQVLEKYGLEKERFYFYPAQFWPHKNQYTLVNAFQQVLDEEMNKDLKLVLCGSDKGNMRYIYDVVKSLNIERSVVFPGFVDNEELYTFYKHSIAMVMPTFLGPTNLPLIEAAQLNCAVLCSDFDGHREMLGENALYFDPNKPDAMADCLRQILNPTLRQRLRSAAAQASVQSQFKIERAMKSVDEVFSEAMTIRRAWGW